MRVKVLCGSGCLSTHIYLRKGEEMPGQMPVRNEAEGEGWMGANVKAEGEREDGGSFVSEELNSEGGKRGGESRCSMRKEAQDLERAGDLGSCMYIYVIYVCIYIHM